jgi:hypothetical protein
VKLLDELPNDNPRLRAAAELVGRTGAKQLQIRRCEEEQPTVWLAVACYGEIVGVWQVGAGNEPLVAVLDLCNKLLDGGKCTHCHRPTGLSDDFGEWGQMPMEDRFCWYKWDPELATFRRSCEGVAA